MTNLSKISPLKESYIFFGLFGLMMVSTTASILYNMISGSRDPTPIYVLGFGLGIPTSATGIHAAYRMLRERGH